MCTRRLAARIVGMVVAALVIATFDEPDAHADHWISGLDSVVIVIEGCIVLGVGDLILTGSDIAYFAKGTPQPTGWAVAKVALGAPQLLLYNGVAAYTAAIGGDKAALITATLAGAYTGSLTVDGIWSLAQKRDPASVYGFSWAIGANTAFTSAAVGTLVGREWPGRAFGILEMVTTAPSIAVSAVRLADPTSERMAWGALLAWSGVLFTHGIVSAVHGGKASDYAGGSRRNWAAPRIGLAPTVVSDGRRRGPGLAIGGVF